MEKRLVKLSEQKIETNEIFIRPTEIDETKTPVNKQDALSDVKRLYMDTLFTL